MNKVDVLAVMRRSANLAETTAERLGLDNRPGHCDYISKHGASANCKQVASEIEQARAAIAELIEAAKLTLRYHDNIVSNGQFNLHIDQERALRAALAKVTP